MLPYDSRPWARTLAASVIAVTVLGCAIYAFVIMRHRHLDTGEHAILLLLLVAVIPPNVAIMRRNNPHHAATADDRSRHPS